MGPLLKVMKKSRAVSCAAAVCTMILLDACWLLGAGSGKVYTSMASSLGEIQQWSLPKLFLIGGGVYLLLALGLCTFCLSEGDPSLSALRGALLGLVIFGVFDLTNLTFFGQGYGMQLAAMDICWGVFLFGTSALVGSLMGS